MFSLIFLPTVVHFDFLVMIMCGTHIILVVGFIKQVDIQYMSLFLKCYLCMICVVVCDLASFDTDDMT